MDTRTLLACLLPTALVALAACGGGNGPASPSQPPAPTTTAASPAIRTTVTVQVVDDTGAPMAGARVGVYGRYSAVTDARGVAEIADVEALASDRWVSVAPATGDWYYASRVDAVPVPGRTSVTFRLLRRRVIVVFDAAVVQRSAGGDVLTARIDFAVLGPDGRVEPPAPEGVRVGSVDCGWGPADCATGPDGATVRVGNFSGNFAPRRGTLTIASVAGAAAAPLLAGTLVDVGARAAAWDARGRRFQAIGTFQRSLGGAPLALGAIGAPPGGASSPPGFTTEPAAFDAALASWAGLSGASNVDALVYPEIRAMARLAAGAPAAPETRRYVVALVDRSFYGVDDSCPGACRRSLDETIATVRASGVRVAALGYSDQLADLAVRTGGAFVAIDEAGQLESAARGLARILDGTLSRQRATVDLEGPAGTFVAGGTVYGLLEAEVGPGQVESVPFAVPIPPG